MLSPPDPLATLHQNLVRDQLEVLVQQCPALFEGFEQRLRQYRTRGAENYRAAIQHAGVTEPLIQECYGCARHDERLRFLHNLPRSAALGSARGRGLEMGLYECSTPELERLVTLLNLLITVLDGLLDEAPDLLTEEDKALLHRLMIQQPWAATGSLPEASTGRTHPVVRLLFTLLIACIREILRGEGWQNSKELRRRFSDAARAAALTEAASTRHTLDIPPGPIDHTQHTLYKKSRDAAWVTALAPLCVNGLPPSLNLQKYQTFSYAFGDYIGWIDDVCDLKKDISSGVWSCVSIEIYEALNRPCYSSTEEIKYYLQSALSLRRIVKHLTSQGLSFFRRVPASLKKVDADSEAVLPMIADLTQSWLTL